MLKIKLLLFTEELIRKLTRSNLMSLEKKSAIFIIKISLP